MMYLQQCCILASLIVLTIAASGNLVEVSTSNGRLRGEESITEKNKTFFAFRGIKYGVAPVGVLRFRPPMPVKSWSGVYNATAHGNQCVQTLSNSNVVQGAEDCLFVNVYTTHLPNGDSNRRLLPVLVWIHGGGFMYLSGDLGLHGADRFLDQDVLVVSLNYRLGIFGFLSTEDNIVPGNYGLKDQVLALQWVQKNIALFGGDPTQVTIFGESAGAASVHYLRQSKLAKGLFHGVIANSGNTLNPWTIARNARQMAFRIGIGNGVWTTDSKTLLEGLRKVDAYKLQQSTSASTLLDLIDIINGLPFAPVLERKSHEAVYTENSFEVQEDGSFNLGPLLHGYNSLEGSGIVDSPWYGKLLFLEQYNIFPSRLTPLDMNASNNGRNIVGQNIRSFYFQNRSVSRGPGFTNYFGDNEFVRGAIKSSQLESHFTNVYLYRFSFTGSALHTNATPDGVPHSEDLHFIWNFPEFAQHTPEALLTVQRTVQMWSNFVKTGNPTPTTSPEVEVTWPVVNATGWDAVHYLDIGDELKLKVNPDKEQMDFWEEQYYVFGYPPYNTY